MATTVSQEVGGKILFVYFVPLAEVLALRKHNEDSVHPYSTINYFNHKNPARSDTKGLRRS